MDNYIRWLHLSDLHMGHKDNPWLNSTLQERLQSLLEQEGKINFILVTGDIIHQGQYADKHLCDQAATLFELLKKYCDHIVFSIGNHDYTRDDVRLNLLAGWEKLDDTEKKKHEHTYEPKLRSAFEPYVEFCKSIIGGDNPLSTQSYIYGNVPGINIVVLNTSIFSGQPMLDEKGEILKKDGQNLVDDTGKLWISESSFPKASSLNGEQPTIVVGHHTLMMFEAHSRNKLLNFMRTVQTSYYFCGHIHKSEDTDVEGIHQIASAGVFQDDENIPTVKLHQMRKSANEHIESRTYVFSKGEWEQQVEKKGEISSSKTENTTICKKDAMIPTEVFQMKSSPASDGAIRFPYNEGVFNLYTSIPRVSDMFTPHLHSGLDEVTYVSDGSVYAYIDGECTKISANSAVLMPKGKLHGFLPAEYPCKYITMGIESGSLSQYETAWNEDIAKIQNLDQELSQDIPGKRRNSIFDEVISFLKCSILEVRWTALEMLKKYLVQDSDDSTYISAGIRQLVIKALRDEDIETKLFGLNLACEFRTNIAAQTIHGLMVNSDKYILAWNCAYYLIAVRTNIQYDNLFNKVWNEDGTSDICQYYRQVIISLLQLMIKRNGTHFSKVYKTYSDNLPKAIPIDDIIIHFTLWYTSFNFSRERIDYTSARLVFQNILGDKGGDILRILSNYSDYQERFRALQLCRDKKCLVEVVRAFFESFKEEQQEEQEKKLMKSNIKEYLRIIVSEECNLRCAYCHHEGRTNSLIGKSLGYNPNFNLEKILDEAKRCGFKKIKISGGEPLLYPNILKVCHKFQNDFQDIGFTTNGTKIIELKDVFEGIKGSRLSFNVTLNSLNEEKYQHITQSEDLRQVIEGIDYLVKSGFKVKLNAVITSYNIDDIESLVAYAARKKINIKLLDLFSFDQGSEEYQHISIAEIKSRLMELYDVTDQNFHAINDYLCVEVMGTQVMIPKRLYSSDCQHNCKMYPCAEGLFGIRVYEDYSCAYCFNGKIYKGGVADFEENISQIREQLDLMKFMY